MSLVIAALAALALLATSPSPTVKAAGRPSPRLQEELASTTPSRRKVSSGYDGLSDLRNLYSSPISRN
jgi:hypothetical protein